MAMKRKLFIFSLLLLCAVQTMASDSIYTSQPQESRYDHRVHRYRKHWAALIPTQFVVQNAGNMGFLSVGIGWNYGKHRQWETALLFGLIPKHQSSRPKLTMTLKENYIPWSVSLSALFPSTSAKVIEQLSVEPLTASIYLNTVYGHEFWRAQPGRYPDKYYVFLSTKFRLNAALGQRITFHIPESRRRGSKSITLFYEVSTCDLYVRAKFQDGNIPLKDILGLSIGLKFQIL